MRDTKSDVDALPSAPDYRSACVVMFGVNLAWVLFAIWAIWGLIAVAVAGWLVNRLIRRIEAARD